LIIERHSVAIETFEIGSVYCNELRCEVDYLTELCFLFPDLVLGPLALGDVHHGTYELNEVAGWAENRVAYLVDISELAAGRTVAVIELELRPFVRCSLELFRDPWSIIRMNALQSGFEWQHLALRIKT
jgi:hypothetical protein